MTSHYLCNDSLSSTPGISNLCFLDLSTYVLQEAAVVFIDFLYCLVLISFILVLYHFFLLFTLGLTYSFSHSEVFLKLVSNMGAVDSQIVLKLIWSSLPILTLGGASIITAVCS
jgi:hypothetical protein